MSEKNTMMTVEVTPSEFKSIAIKTLNAKSPQPILVQGPGGTGKTSIAEQIAVQLKKKVFIVRGSGLDPVDLTGMPRSQMVKDEMETVYDRPMLLPRFDEEALVFFDEINRSREEVLQTFLRVLEGRGTDSYKFNPEKHRIMAAFNPNDGSHQVNKMDKVLTNRGFLYSLRTSMQDFQEFMYSKKYDTAVMNYLTYSNKSLLVEPNADNDAEVAWASPRSWENLAKLMTEVSDFTDNEVLKVSCASVGIEEGTAFTAFRCDPDRPVRALDVLTDYTDDLKKKFIKQQAEKRLDKASVTMSDLVLIINTEWQDGYMPKLKQFWPTVKENELKAMLLKGIEAGGKTGGKDKESLFDKVVFGLGITEELSTLLSKHDMAMK